MKSISLGFLIVLCFPLSLLALGHKADYAMLEVGHGERGGLGLQFSGYDYTWSNVALKLGKDLPHRFRVETTVELGYHRVSRPIHEDGVSLGGAFWLDRDFGIPNTSADLFLGVGAGLALLHPSNEQPLLGSSGVIGMPRTHVGLRWLVEKRIISVALYADHASDPFHEGSRDGSDDWDRNTLGIALGYGRRF